MFKKLIVILTACFCFSASAATQDKYPVVILGGGISGLTCGIYLARSGYAPLIIEGKEPALITKTHSVENWPGESKISGTSLIEKIRKQALLNGCKIIPQEAVAVNLSNGYKEIHVKNLYNNKTEVIKTDCLVIAMGASSNRLNIEGENKYFGKGVSVCALCDGTAYKNKTVSVIGGSDAALTDALYLSNIAKKVYIIMRKENFRKNTDRKNSDLLKNKKNIEILTDTVVEKISGTNDFVTSISLKNIKENRNFNLETAGVFLAIGTKPNTEIFHNKLDLDAQGYIIVKNNAETSQKGVYAIGDIVSGSFKQAVTAAGDGATAAIQLLSYLDPPVSTTTTEQQECITDSIIRIRSYQDLEKEINRSSIPLVLDFGAKWCGACRRIEPVIHQKAKDLAGIAKILMIDVDKNPDIAAKYNIRAMPTAVLLSEKGEYLEKQTGSSSVIDLIGRLEKK